MAGNAAKQKKFDRWKARLSDASLSVRVEAAKVMVEVANSHGDLGQEALNVVTSTLTRLKKETDQEELICLCYGLLHMDGSLLAASPKLLGGLAAVIPSRDLTSEILMRLLWGLIESERLKPTNSEARKVVDLAKVVLEAQHDSARRDALKICDWGEDNL